MNNDNWDHRKIYSPKQEKIPAATYLSDDEGFGKP